MDEDEDEDDEDDEDEDDDHDDDIRVCVFFTLFIISFFPTPCPKYTRGDAA